MLAARRIQARKRQFERQPLTSEDDLSLAQSSERPDDPQTPLERAVRGRLHVAKERIRAIGKRVGLQRTEREMVNCVKPAPHGRLRRQKKVSARQIHGLIGSLCPGNVRIARAPVPSIDVGHGFLEHRKRHEPRPSHRVKEPLKIRQLYALPAQSEPHVNRINLGEIPEQIHAQDRTIDPAADKNGDRTLKRRFGHLEKPGLSATATVSRPRRSRFPIAN